ncbi:MAG: hypothetical protein OES84_00910, partial [Kiritimatiellaceae bacterium]|nr:hypothetical protein [Kiritimatiellaceae bacterium]
KEWIIAIVPIAVYLLVAGCGPRTTKGKKAETLSSGKSMAGAGAHQKSALQTELEFAAGTNLLAYTYKPAAGSNEFVYVHHSYTESLLSMIDAESLKKYEGSYSLEDLQNQESGSSLLNLNSSWITGGDIPQVGVHVARNPITGNYEVSGGELFLPNPGMGVSYERIEESGETRTFLNWKREF